MEKNMYTGKGNHRINVPNTIHLTGWKFYSVIAGLVGSIGLMLWPIVMDPVLHVNKYKKKHEEIQTEIFQAGLLPGPCFTCCTKNGPRVYNIDPLVEKCRFPDVGIITQCEMLYRTNLLAMVAADSSSQYPDNTVLVYDDLSKQFVLQLTFHEPVKAVRLRRDKIVVATLRQVCVFSFPAPTQHIFTFETPYNTYGLCEVSPLLTAERNLVVFPSFKTGSVQLVDLCSTDVSSSSAPVTINAHRSDLICLAINQKGTMIATASSMGTLIRVFDTIKRQRVHELRRGSDNAFLYCINFSQNSEFLCCASDKGTVHIFALKDPRYNKRSSLSKLGINCNYVESQWSFANFTVLPECACICAFSSQNSVIAICVDGTFHKYVFNTDGSCNRNTFDIFLDDFVDEDC
ncbi:hypothetical protein PGB90_005003 [Kerria lacca]